jgi:tryptophan-rich sensory protein
MVLSDKTVRTVTFIFSLLICQLAGVIGSIFTYPAIATWYATLAKPDFSPPNWIFAPVWISLFVLMGVSLHLVIRNKGNKKPCLTIFGIQLSLNALWSFLFFGLKNPFYAFVEIIVLWIAILMNILCFRRVDKRAAYLLIPYLAWVTIASILNYYIWVLNP